MTLDEAQRLIAKWGRIYELRRTGGRSAEYFVPSGYFVPGDIVAALLNQRWLLPPDEDGALRPAPPALTVRTPARQT